MVKKKIKNHEAESKSNLLRGCCNRIDRFSY